MTTRSELVQCTKCGLNFLHEEGLGKHMKRVHEPKDQLRPSKYKCDRCSDEFDQKDDFKKHKLPESFRCELCDSKGEETLLPNKCELNFHIITHRIGKPKICDNCGSEFKNNKNLKNHLEQDKTVSCRRCNVIFKGSCPLQKHIKNEHDTTTEPIPALTRSRPITVRVDPIKQIRVQDPMTQVKVEMNPPATIKRKPAPTKIKTELKKTKVEENVMTPSPSLEEIIPQEHLVVEQGLVPVPGLASEESVLGI